MIWTSGIVLDGPQIRQFFDGKMSKIIGKIISFSVVALIFYFIGKSLFSNWQQVKEYQFSLNYFYLVISFIFLAINLLARGLVWKKIINFLQPDNDLKWKEAVRIDVYSQLGRYLPGKIFGIVGKAYLARNKNISRKNLYLSVIYVALFYPIAAFLLSLFLISFFFDYDLNFPNFYLISLLIIIAGLTIIHFRVFQRLIALFLTRVTKEPVQFDVDLNWFQKLKIVFYYSIVEFFMGLGFFYLINSITFLPIQNLLSIVGIYILAGILGLVAVFAPGGLGVREGVLILFLQVFFPLNIAILISLLARIWASITEVFLAGGFYFLGKVKKMR